MFNSLCPLCALCASVVNSLSSYTQLNTVPEVFHNQVVPRQRITNKY
jgi:hypothetical protein